MNVRTIGSIACCLFAVRAVVAERNPRSRMHPPSALNRFAKLDVIREKGRGTAYIDIQMAHQFLELIRASATRNVFIGIEHLTQDGLDGIRARCEAEARAEAAASQAEATANRRGAKAAERATSLFGMVLFAAVQTLVTEGDLG